MLALAPLASAPLGGRRNTAALPPRERTMGIADTAARAVRIADTGPRAVSIA